MSIDAQSHKRLKAARRAHRTRSRLYGTAQRPRLSVHISNKHIAAQLINDESGKTLVYVTTLKHAATEPMTDKAAWVGGEIARRAAKAKLKNVVFDRGERKYHNRLKSLAEAARAGGLEF